MAADLHRRVSIPKRIKTVQPQEEREVGQMVTEVSKMDDDLITPQSEDKVPMEYSKLTEEIGELKGEGEI